MDMLVVLCCCCLPFFVTCCCARVGWRRRERSPIDTRVDFKSSYSHRVRGPPQKKEAQNTSVRGPATPWRLMSNANAAASHTRSVPQP